MLVQEVRVSYLPPDRWGPGSGPGHMQPEALWSAEDRQEAEPPGTAPGRSHNSDLQTGQRPGMQGFKAGYILHCLRLNILYSSKIVLFVEPTDLLWSITRRSNGVGYSVTFTEAAVCTWCLIFRTGEGKHSTLRKKQGVHTVDFSSQKLHLTEKIWCFNSTGSSSGKWPLWPRDANYNHCMKKIIVGLDT